MSCKGNAIDLVSQKEIFALKKKYRVSDKTLQKITNFYKSDKEVLDLKDLGSKIMMEEIEDVILKQLKSKGVSKEEEYETHRKRILEDV